MRTARCTRCGAVHPVNAMIKTELAKRGGRASYVCERCATTNERYHTSNNVLQGTRKANGVGVGIEFESSFSDEYARNTMFEYGFIPTHDCSIQADAYDGRYGYDDSACEYVSGIMQGLNKASKFAVTAQTLIDNGHMKVNGSCGTHLHVSVNKMQDSNGNLVYMDYIRRFYHSLFTPLTEAMCRRPDLMTTLFGRQFGHYCEPIINNSNAGNRYNFINVTNDTNIEFRICKFDNASQYQEAMRFAVDATKCIVTNFCEHFNDTDIDNTRYANMTEYRKHKAQVTAKKLVKLFEKHANNL